MNRFTAPIEKLSRDIKGYADARVDNLRLETVKGASQGASAVAGILLIVLLAGAFALVLSFALVLFLGEILGSYATAAFIVAGALGLITVILVLARKSLFRNTFVPTFADILASRKDLRTRADLEAATAKSRTKIEKKEAAINKGIASVQTFYSPGHLLKEGLIKLCASPFRKKSRQE